MAEANDKAVIFDKSSELEAEDVWDDSLLQDAFNKQQRMVEKALKAKKAGPENGAQRADSATSPSSSKVRKVISDPPPVHCGTLIPKIPLFAAGDACRCVYSADGLEYEADIVELFEEKDQCLVRYVGYENEEIRPMSIMKDSRGEEARVRQSRESQEAVRVEGNSDLLQMPSSPEPDITPVSGRSEVTKVISRIAEQEKKSSEQAAPFKKKGKPAKDRLTNESIILPYRKLDTSNPVTNSPPTTSSSSHPTSCTVPPQSRSSVCPPPLPPSLSSGRSEEDDALASMLMSWYMSGYHTGYYEAMKKYNK